MPVRKHITGAQLMALSTGFKAHFNAAFKELDPLWRQIAEEVKSTGASENYAWLAQIPGMKRWVDERVIKRLTQKAYMIENELWEDTIAVARVAIEDDKTGTFAMAFKGMGEAAATHPEELIFQALAAGFDSPCYDGQNFFDTDHPVTVKGEEVSVSNMTAGAGPAWFLLATNRAVKPLIYQNRFDPELEDKTDPKSSDHVFKQDEFLYGARSRGQAGYTYWQLAHGSKADLTAENFEAARAAMTSLKGDEGRPLGIVPNLLVVPPELESKAEKILKADKVNGEDNVNKGKAEILMSPWLAA